MGPGEAAWRPPGLRGEAGRLSEALGCGAGVEWWRGWPVLPRLVPAVVCVQSPEHKRQRANGLFKATSIGCQ